MARAGSGSSGGSSGGGHFGRVGGGHSIGGGRAGSGGGDSDSSSGLDIFNLVLSLADFAISCIDLYRTFRKNKSDVPKIEDNEEVDSGRSIPKLHNAVVVFKTQPPYGECKKFITASMCNEVVDLLLRIEDKWENTQFVEFFDCTVNSKMASQLLDWLERELEVMY